ncbi:Trehalose/maltose import ATP-binding protein MalK [uncultured archaeon]|nr:Trehalose/maltose import ATP-binding protein MalK [uncultured archaeon]
MGDKKDKEFVDYKYNLKEYWSFLRNHKLIFFSLLLFASLTEAKNIFDKYVFKVIIDEGTLFSSGSIALDVFVKVLLFFGGLYIVVSLLNVANSWIKAHLLNDLSAKVIYDLKQKYFRHILNLDYNFHTTHKTGSLISRMTRGASAIDRLGDSLVFEFAPVIFQTIFALIAFSYLQSYSSAIIVATMVAFVSFSYIMQKVSEPSNVRANKQEDREKGNLADFFTNTESIRHFGKEKLVAQKYTQLTEDTRDYFLTNWHIWRWTSSGQVLIIFLGTLALLYFSLKQFISGQISLGTLVFIYTTFTGLMGPLWGLVHGIRNFSRSMADFQELFDYGKIESKIKDLPNARNLKINKGEIIFDNITFNYPGKKKIFENFSLKVPANKRVALVGHSGCGKSTLTRLLYRLYDVNSGKISIDGHDIKEVKQTSLREEMSIVPQECVLFDDTIYNNILFSNPSASREEVLKAIRFAQLDKLIESMPEKENTIVGERGVKLSGGEKQRVSIARAILADKKILVLDEATSALDSETEFEIQKDLEKLMKGRTSIVIAHRLSTIMKADIIVVMKKGKILQMGSHRELISEGGEYKRLWNFQRGGYLKDKSESDGEE